MPTIEPSRAADIFTPAVVAYAISAAWEVGVLDELQQEGSLEVAEFADRKNLHAPSVQAIVDALACRDIVGTDQGSVRPGPAFEEIFTTKGFFYWLTRGSGQLFSDMPALTRNDARKDDFVQRDLRAVGIACRDLGAQFFDQPLFDFLDEISFSNAADLGCGSGDRLIRIASEHDGVRCVGIDISSSAVQLATEAVAEAGLQDRIKLVRADARSLEPVPEFQGVDLLTCYLMGHDFWPRENCIASFRRIRAALPDIQTFVLCDTYRSEVLPSANPPVFTPGFEFGHAIMGKYLPTLSEWQGVFHEAGWKLVEQRDISTPAFTSMFILSPL